MKALITGISGTLGGHVSRRLLQASATVIGYSRDEQKQMAILPHPNLTLYLGDVRDRDRLIECSRGVDVIFHFAALKCVDKLEENPEESVQTNIIGTQNVLHAQRLNGIKRVVLSSTDKACLPRNVYGFCKATAERLVLRNSNNVVCRYGNVLASRGSVVPKFMESLKSEGKAYVTDKKMTRFFILQEDAAEFVIRSAAEKTGGLKIPPMKACTIPELVDAIATRLSIPKYTIQETGIRPGEKIHEHLRSGFEGVEMTSETAPRFTKDELCKLIEKASA